jgi:hypothetical protein
MLVAAEAAAAAILVTATMLIMIIMTTEFIIHFAGPISVCISRAFLVVNWETSAINYQGLLRDNFSFG